MNRKTLQRRKHTPSFKWEAVQLMQDRLASGLTLQRVSEELDIDPDQLRGWAKLVAGAPKGASADEIFPGHGKRRAFRSAMAGEAPLASESTAEELRRLRRENERLRLERDFLKKAAAFFAKESQ
jgi:transposase